MKPESLTCPPEVFSISALAKTIECLYGAAREAMSQRRFLHVLGVTHTAMVLAELHGLNPADAAVAALLHDVSKEVADEKIAAEMKSLGRPLRSHDRPYPRTWHGLHAAAIGPERFGVSDAGVLRAVALHTTGDAELTPLEQALFIADFCEPNRRIDEAPEVLATAKVSLEAGFRRALDLKTRHMLAKPKFELHPRTWRCIRKWLPERAQEIPPELIPDSLATGTRD